MPDTRKSEITTASPAQDSKAKVEAKLVAEQDKGKRMAEIYREVRDIEALEKAAKGDAKKPHKEALAALDLEFNQLIA